MCAGARTRRAMPCRRKNVCAGARTRRARCAEICRVSAGARTWGVMAPPPLSLRGAKRRGNPRPCRNAWQIGCCLGEFVGGYEFALSAAICHVPPQGERIATPVCALVRNDMQKFAGCLRITRALPGECRETYLLCVRVTVLCMSLRGAKRRGNPHLLAVEHDRKQHFRRIRKSCEFAGTLPHSRPVIRCGLL